MEDQHEDHPHATQAAVRFEHGLGMGIEGLHVQLSGNGQVFAGTTDLHGNLPALYIDGDADPHVAAGSWIMPGPYPVTVEVSVSRTKGGWRRIGSFQLTQDESKQIVISAGNAATPMPLARMGRN